METNKRLMILSSVLNVLLAITSIVLMVIVITRVKGKPNINNYIVEQADKDWFDYCYEIVENYDENGNVRYHITYYYSKTNETGTFEILVYEKDGKLTSEEI